MDVAGKSIVVKDKKSGPITLMVCPVAGAAVQARVHYCAHPKEGRIGAGKKGVLGPRTPCPPYLGGSESGRRVGLLSTP